MQLFSLSEIFNNRLFRIPDFQRGYSWEEDQLNDFWEDLQILGNDKTHYTGQLTIKQVDNGIFEKWLADNWRKEAGYRAYHVIDGQQRLTTSIICINEVLNRFNNNERINKKEQSDWIKRFLYETCDGYKSYIFGYEKDVPSDEFFRKTIIDGESVKFDETSYTANLKEAKIFFKNWININMEKLGDEQGKIWLENLLRKLTVNFKYELAEVSKDDLNIYVTFETINNRGKKLSNLELLKNRFIYLSTLLDNVSQGEKLRKRINEVWKVIYQSLGKNNKNFLSDDEFLRNHWIMSFKFSKGEAEFYSKFLLHQHFTAKNLLGESESEKNIKHEDIQEYIESLAKSAPVWFDIHNPSMSKIPDDVKEWMAKLNRIGFNSFKPLLMAVLVKEPDNKKIIELIKAIENLVFVIFRLSRRSSNLGNTDLYKLASEYYNNDNKTLDDVIKIIVDFASEKRKTDDFKSYIEEHFKDKKLNGFYSWDGIKYFLYEYELSLQNSAGAKILWDEFDKRKKEESIEHIYPQTPDDWTEFDKYKGTDKKHILCHTLGNLLLLSRSKNSVLQNKPFDVKKEYINKDGNSIGYYNGSYSEIEIAKEPQWTEQEILKRGIKMLEFMEKRWNVNFSNKESLLRLDFLINATK